MSTCPILDWRNRWTPTNTGHDARGRSAGHAALHVARAGRIEGRPIIAAIIYSLGMILYEMATGEVPFSGESSLQVMFQHVQQQPKDPAAAQSGDTRVSRDSIILKCLEKDPALRYQSAQELLQDLESGTPPTRIVRLRIAEMGYPKWLFAVIGMVLLLGIGLAIRPVRELRAWPLHHHAITSRKCAAGPSRTTSLSRCCRCACWETIATLHYEAEGVTEALSAKLFQMKNVHLRFGRRGGEDQARGSGHQDRASHWAPSWLFRAPCKAPGTRSMLCPALERCQRKAAVDQGFFGSAPGSADH